MLLPGCIFSYLSYKNSEKEILQERIMASGNEDAIKALEMGISEKKIISAVPIEKGVALKISIQPGMMEVLTKNGLRQTGAAILDAGTIYAIAQATKSNSDTTNNDNSTTNNTTNNNSTNGNNSPIINGNDNNSTGDDNGGE